MTAASASYCLILAFRSSASDANVCSLIFLRLRRDCAETRFMAKRFSLRMLVKEVDVLLVSLPPVSVVPVLVLMADASLVETETAAGAACRPKEECDIGL